MPATKKSSCHFSWGKRWQTVTRTMPDTGLSLAGYRNHTKSQNIRIVPMLKKMDHTPLSKGLSELIKKICDCFGHRT
jgi:hypothetical protein